MCRQRLSTLALWQRWYTICPLLLLWKRSWDNHLSHRCSALTSPSLHRLGTIHSRHHIQRQSDLLQHWWYKPYIMHPYHEKWTMVPQSPWVSPHDTTHRTRSYTLPKQSNTIQTLPPMFLSLLKMKNGPLTQTCTRPTTLKREHISYLPVMHLWKTNSTSNETGTSTTIGHHHTHHGPRPAGPLLASWKYEWPTARWNISHGFWFPLRD
jgi:hypothetical protein